MGLGICGVSVVNKARNLPTKPSMEIQYGPTMKGHRDFLRSDQIEMRIVVMTPRAYRGTVSNCAIALVYPSCKIIDGAV